MGERDKAIDVLELVCLYIISEVEENREWHRQQGHDHDGDADEVVFPREVGGWFQRTGLDGAEDPVYELCNSLALRFFFSSIVSNMRERGRA